MPSNLSGVEVEYVSLVDRAAVRDPQNKSEPRRFLITKREGDTDDEGATMTAEEMQAAIEKAEQEAADAKAAQEKAEAEAETAKDELAKAEAKKEDEENEATKSEGTQIKKEDLPPEVVSMLEKQESEMADLRKQAEDAAELAKAEYDRRVTGEFIAKAEDLSSLAIQPVEFGPVLKRASEKLDKEDFDALYSLLKSADESVARSDLFKAVGQDAGGSRVPAGAEAEVQQKAAELRKNDPKLSLGEAEAMVMKGDPELQARYLAAVR